MKISKQRKGRSKRKRRLDSVEEREREKGKSKQETGVKERLLIMVTTRPKLTAPLHTCTHADAGIESQTDKHT